MSLETRHLLSKRKAGKISDADYEAKKERISKAEKGVEDLESKVAKGKKLD
jgi:hypothetical protein